MMNTRLLAFATALTIASGASAAPASLPPLAVYSAGSMTGALGAMLKRYTAETGETIDLHTGPAGLLLGEIEKGGAADVFVSANMAHPQKLTAEGKSTATIVFARNRICITALPTVGLTSANLLDKLLDPSIGIGTSTPKADPGGDYAWALFEKADTVHPGAAAILKAKAKQLVGGTIIPKEPKSSGTTAQSMAAHGIGVSIGYCSSHGTTPDKSVDKVELPANLAIPVDYGMTVLTTSGDAIRREAADRLALFLMSPDAQAMVVPYGFVPVAGSPGPLQ
jgi:molybdate transport system substrate-binding protein